VVAYFDSFVIAVLSGKRDEYRRHCETADSWFLENGALRVVEAWGQDVPTGTITDFRRAVAAQEDETVCVGFIEWPDQATRNAAMGRMMGGGVEDERLDPEKNPAPFDGKRMIFGGFEAIYDRSAG
jgi:uncharacterized protein YbaA (DUF1428 family)